MSNVLTTVATFADPVEAHLAKNRLEASGLRAFLANEETFDMDWMLGNAVGWIRLEVSDQDAEAARAVLKRHDEPGASSNAEIPNGMSVIDDSDYSAAGMREDDQDDEIVDDFEPAKTDRERDADRAFRGAIMGILFLPIQVYVAYLVFKIFVSDESLGDRERRKAIIAAVISFLTLAGVYFFLRGR